MARAASETEKTKIKSDADTEAAAVETDAIKMLTVAEGAASGDEKLAIQFELAERYSQSGNCEMAGKYFGLVARETGQPPLRDEALRRAKACRPGMDASRHGI